MISASSSPIEERDLCLMYPHLIDWEKEGQMKLDWFQNNEAIDKFLGARDGIPYDDHKVGFTIDLDRTAYFGEASSSFQSR